MASLLKYVWKRNSKQVDPHYTHEVMDLDPDTVMEFNEAGDSFTEVHVRPLTYAEAAGALNPPGSVPTRIVAEPSDNAASASTPHQQASIKAQKPHVSPKVVMNLEYEGDDIIPRARPRKHSKTRIPSK